MPDSQQKQLQDAFVSVLVSESGGLITKAMFDPWIKESEGVTAYCRLGGGSYNNDSTGYQDKEYFLYIEVRSQDIEPVRLAMELIDTMFLDPGSVAFSTLYALGVSELEPEVHQPAVKFNTPNEARGAMELRFEFRKGY